MWVKVYWTLYGWKWGWSMQWKDVRMRKGRKLIPWKDTILKDSIILYAIELTKIYHLKVAVVEYLKKNAYSFVYRFIM